MSSEHRTVSWETVDQVIAHVAKAYNLSPERVDWLTQSLRAEFAPPPTEMDLLRAEVAALRSEVATLARRPSCPHVPRA